MHRRETNLVTALAAGSPCFEQRLDLYYAVTNGYRAIERPARRRGLGHDQRGRQFDDKRHAKYKSARLRDFDGHHGFVRRDGQHCLYRNHGIQHSVISNVARVADSQCRHELDRLDGRRTNLTSRRSRECVAGGFTSTTDLCGNFGDFLPKYVWHMEEPVCQPPAIALYFVSKLASKNVKVLISGEGGDEAFAGYETYRNLFWFEKTKRLLGPLRHLAGPAMTWTGRLLKSRAFSKYGPLMTSNFDDYYFSRTASPFSLFGMNSSKLYSTQMGQLINRARSISPTRKHLANASAYSIFEKMLYVDTNTWLPDDLLVKADKMTMANSVELRVPFLDHEVLEFAAQLPRNQKVRGLQMKYLLKKSLRKRVPDPILKRRKAGFPVPYEKWLRTDLKCFVNDVLRDQKSSNRGYFEARALGDLLDRNAAGVGNSKEVFSFLILELWHRIFVDHQVQRSDLQAPSISADQRHVVETH